MMTQHAGEVGKKVKKKGGNKTLSEGGKAEAITSEVLWGGRAPQLCPSEKMHL